MVVQKSDPNAATGHVRKYGFLNFVLFNFGFLGEVGAESFQFGTNRGDEDHNVAASARNGAVVQHKVSATNAASTKSHVTVEQGNVQNLEAGLADARTVPSASDEHGGHHESRYFEPCAFILWIIRQFLITLLFQVKSPTKILPAQKGTQHIVYKKPTTAQSLLPQAQVIQVAGAQTLNTGQLHQINIPGKGVS